MLQSEQKSKTLYSNGQTILFIALSLILETLLCYLTSYLWILPTGPAKVETQISR